MKVLLPVLVIWLVILFLKGFHPAAPVEAPNPGAQRRPPSQPGGAVTPRVHSPEKARTDARASNQTEPYDFEVHVPAPPDGTVTSRKFVWKTLGVRGHKLKTGEVNFTTVMGELNYQIASYGIPEEKTTFRYREGELERARRMRREAFSKRGILWEDGHLKPDYQWMIQQSKKSTYPFSRSLFESFQRKSGNSRDLVAYVAGFVQNLDYRIPESPRTLPWNPNQKMITCGVNMPLETLYNGWGDCDSKSVLLASLFANIGKTSTIFVEGNRHVFIGVAGAPGRNDHFVKHRNIKYILIETTSPWPIGKIPKKSFQAMLTKQLKVYRVD